MGSIWRKQRCISLAESNHEGIDVEEKDMLLILDIISITQVTCGGVTLIPCRSFKTWGVDTKSEMSCTANDTRQRVTVMLQCFGYQPAEISFFRCLHLPIKIYVVN